MSVRGINYTTSFSSAVIDSESLNVTVMDLYSWILNCEVYSGLNGC